MNRQRLFRGVRTAATVQAIRCPPQWRSLLPEVPDISTCSADNGTYKPVSVFGGTELN